MVIVGSNTRLIKSATVPSVSVKTANRSGSVVSRLNHHPGWRAMSRTVLGDSVGGMVKPLWTLSHGRSIVPDVELEPPVRVGRRGGEILR